MKIKAEHLTRLEALVKVGVTRIPPPQAYMSRDPSIRGIDKVVCPLKRHRWDALYAVGGTEHRDLLLEVYEYANDAHIDTALRAAINKVLS